MSRRTVVVVSLLAGTIPMLVAALFLFGCCVLPFHHAIHGVMPLCGTFARLAAGEGDHDHHHQATAPAAAKQQKVSPTVPIQVPRTAAAAFSTTAALRVRETRKAPRNVMSQGALRCDDDVGLQPWIRVFLI